jgi:hypothetical protein
MVPGNCSIYTRLRPSEEFSHRIAFILAIVVIVINLFFVFAAFVFLFIIFFIRLFSMPEVDG